MIDACRAANRRSRRLLAVLALGLAWGATGAIAGTSIPVAQAATPALAATPAPVAIPAPAAASAGGLYVVSTAHLDTQWRWTIQNTIDEYIPATLHENFALMKKYPDYVFSFEGAFRYMLMKEYYPEEYKELKEWVARGRWRVGGSWVDAVDTNIPSPESLIRHTLYGNGFYRREFGHTSRDVFLPDCFGFGYALPSVAAHCGLLGFSTQKLAWGSAVGIPFDVGIWQGVDGSRLIAALNPGEYVGRIGKDLSADSAAAAPVLRLGRLSGIYAGYKYIGTGDTGGAPTDGSVDWLEKSIHGTGPLRVRSAASDQMARDLAGELDPSKTSRLPLYKGELLMTSHGSGCYTSEAAMKRFNRKNELLADEAERGSVLARWLGLRPYPKTVLRDAWIRFLWHQFHDDLTGTSIPEAYAFSWNDELISQNQFAQVLEDAVSAVSREMDTEVEGTPLVVYNPLGAEREDLVEATVDFERAAPAFVRVFDPEGEETPAQCRRTGSRRLLVSFTARVPAAGCAVFDLRPSRLPCPLSTCVSASPAGLENGRYRLRLDQDGNVASIRDKRYGRELLSAPLQIQLLKDAPPKWAAWEVDYGDVSAPPRSVVGGPAEIRVLESGPARAALEITRPCDGSVFRQTISLGANGAADRLEIGLEVDWNSPGTLAKAAFPLAVRADSVLYDLGLGAIRRGTNTKRLYEVPAQQWADLSDPALGFGVAVLNDCKYGWDHPDDATLRLTLLHTPEVNDRWAWIRDQATMDLGEHRMVYALYAHGAGGGNEEIAAQAARLNQPLLAFRAPRHSGALGRSFSFLRVTTPDDRPGAPAVVVKALKEAEESDEIVVRLQEVNGRTQDRAHVAFASPIINAREVNGAEEPVHPLAVCEDGTLSLSFGPFQPRTLAVRLARYLDRPCPPAEASVPLDLPFNERGFTPHGRRSGIDLDGKGHALPLELLPGHLSLDGLGFRFPPRTEGRMNLLLCRGQRLTLPRGEFNAVTFLATSFRGDREAAFEVDGKAHRAWIQDFTEPIGQWDSRLLGGRLAEDRAAIIPAYLKEEPVGWVGTHLHQTDGGHVAYAKAIFYRLRFDLPPGARSITLPADPAIGLIAATLSRDEAGAVVAEDLYDHPSRTAVRCSVADGEFLDSARVELSSPNRGAVLRYTTDGHIPNLSSPVYQGPVTVRSSCTVMARAFVPGMDDRTVARLSLKQLEYLQPAASAGARPGLAVRVYGGDWSKLPDFAGLTPASREILPQVALPSSAPKENYGAVEEGWIHLDRAGLYTFHLWSDDGSAFYLAGRKLIDNDGLHGNGEVAAHAALRPGSYPIRVEFFQGPGDAALKLEIEGPGLARQEAPAAALSHTAEQE